MVERLSSKTNSTASTLWDCITLGILGMMINLFPRDFIFLISGITSLILTFSKTVFLNLTFFTLKKMVKTKIEHLTYFSIYNNNLIFVLVTGKVITVEVRVGRPKSTNARLMFVLSTSQKRWRTAPSESYVAPTWWESPYIMWNNTWWRLPAVDEPQFTTKFNTQCANP